VEKIIILGKGGIGKSTIAANLSALFALQGRKVLHVGCDPKHDSTRGLVKDEFMVTFMDRQIEDRKSDRGAARVPGNILVKGRLGIDCIEAGGPEPGIGCAGRGISLMLESFSEMGLLERGNYDVCIFDVLGDVVCGGFAAPMRKGFAEKVLIVVSEERMSLFAANNIAKAIRTYSANGVYLAGLVANSRDGDARPDGVYRFAKELKTRVLEVIPRDPMVREMEFCEEGTVVERAPQTPFSRKLASLARGIVALRRKDCPLPVPMNNRDFRRIWTSREARVGR
jgi:nitrogenase iron protein NifH